MKTNEVLQQLQRHMSGCKQTTLQPSTRALKLLSCAALVWVSCMNPSYAEDLDDSGMCVMQGTPTSGSCATPGSVGTSFPSSAPFSVAKVNAQVSHRDDKWNAKGRVKVVAIIEERKNEKSKWREVARKENYNKRSEYSVNTWAASVTYPMKPYYRYRGRMIAYSGTGSLGYGTASLSRDFTQ